MLYQLLEDLRFVIGAFFGVVSLILLVMGYTADASVVFGVNMNLFSGWTMLVFSLLMFGLVYLGRNDKK